MAWLTGWSYRKKLTVDHSKVDSDCSDFPVKAIFDKDNFAFAHALETGNDVRFTSSDGETLLKYERELHQVFANPDGLLFDGTNDKVTCGDVSALDSASALTVECRFIWMGGGTPYQPLVAKLPSNNSYNGFYLRLRTESGVAQFTGLGADQSVSSTTTILPGVEYHVAGVWTGTKMRIIVNGVQEAEIDSSTNNPDAGTAELEIGHIKPYLTDHWANTLHKEVRVWTVAKTESQINASKAYGAITGSEDDLECLYLFDEGSGTTLTDSANSNNGTVSGATWTTLPGYGVYHVKVPTASSTSDTEFYCYYGKSDATDGADGENVWDSNYAMVHHMGSSLLDSTSNDNDGTNSGSTLGLARDGYFRSFDGSNDYIDLTGLTIANTNDLSFEIMAQHGESAHLFDAQTGRWVIGWNLTDNLGVYYNSWFQVTTDIPADGGMHLVGVTLDQGTERKIYIDDNSPDAAGSGPTVAIGGDVIMGARYALNSAFYNGKMSEYRISTTLRSDAWIKATHASLADTLLTYGAEEALTPTARPRVMVVWA